jgi:hypothetical protein
MSNISERTNVYLWTYHPPHSGQRAWVAETNLVRNNLGNLILKPELDTDPKCAMSFRYSVGVIAKRRFETEGYINPTNYDFHFSLTATGEEIATGNVTSAPIADGRTIMYYRGLIARPGVDVNHGRVWYVRFPGQAIEGIRGDSAEDAVNKTYERNLQHLAEAAPPPEPEVVPPAPTKSYEGRLRPGSRK